MGCGCRETLKYRLTLILIEKQPQPPPSNADAAGALRAGPGSSAPPAQAPGRPRSSMRRLAALSSAPGALTGERPVAPRHRPPVRAGGGVPRSTRETEHRRAPRREWARPGPSHTKWRRRHRSRSARPAAIAAVPAPPPSCQSEPAVPLRDGSAEPIETRIAEEKAVRVSAARHYGSCSPPTRCGSAAGAVADSPLQDPPRPHVAGAVSRRWAEETGRAPRGWAGSCRGGGAAHSEASRRS